MYYIVIWPYHDCKVFAYGEKVAYWQACNELRFWHPKEKKWVKASRKTILHDAEVLITALDRKVIQDVIF